MTSNLICETCDGSGFVSGDEWCPVCSGEGCVGSLDLAGRLSGKGQAALGRESSEQRVHQPRYRTIVADPPWSVQRQGGGYAWRQGQPSGIGYAKLDYLTMTLEEIAALPVDELAAHKAHLFMWTTQRHLRAAFDIVEAWGFRYVCMLVWCKEPHGWGPGGIFQSTLEHCLYATRGAVGRSAQIDRQWWMWPRGAHSAKPEAFLDMVETHFPDPRLELFARRQRLGWDTWGDEALEHVQIGSGRGGPT